MKPRRQGGGPLRRVAAWAALTAPLAGCDKPAPPAEVPATATAAAPRGDSVMRGVVRFKGTPPEGEDLPGARCHASAAATVVSPVAVSASGGLAGVMVYVNAAGPSGPATGLPPVVLDQVNCQYVPAVVGVRAGQVLRVTSGDATLHNVHALCLDNPGVNFGMTGAGQSRDLTFAVPERFVVKCDVHPWMRASVQVFDHPYFAVSGAGGEYEIRGLPPGEHTVVFSHPFLGDRERRVTVGEGKAVEADVVFEKGRD